LGVDIICRLAYYSFNNALDDGETMDSAEATPEGSASTCPWHAPDS
jgi:hypothetical protein